jgi:PAS domain S-box-containing protein
MVYDEFQGLARALFEESDDALMLLDAATGRILDANGAAQRTTGFPLRRMVGSLAFEYLRTNGGGWAVSFPMPLRTVHLPNAEWGGHVVTFRGGSLPADITFTRLKAKPRPLALARVRVPPAGHRSTAGGPTVRLSHLVAAAPDCLWSAELTGPGEGRFRFLAPVVEQIVGRNAREIGEPLRSWRELVHPDDRQVWDDACERRSAGKSTALEYRVVWPDGSVRWVRDEARASRPSPTRPVRLAGVFADVTAWREAEAALRRTATMVDNAGDAIISQSADGLVVDWNQGAERLYGYTKAEMTDQPVLRLFAHEAVDGYEETVRRVRSGQPAPAYETSQVRKDGARIAVSLRLSPVGGEAEGISIIARDVGRS